jgi:hypothetical protein
MLQWLCGERKMRDTDADLGIFDVQKLDAEPVLLFDMAPEGAKAKMATIVPPNTKCSSCYHYQDQNTACTIGTKPSKCGIGNNSADGYAPLIMNEEAAEAWKTKRMGTTAHGGRVGKESLRLETPKFKIEILGDEKLTLSLEAPLRKSVEHRPPSSWLRYMSRYVTKGEPQFVAAGIWWDRCTKLPTTLEKGLFQEIMTRTPTDAEIARAEAATRCPDGLSKSEWRRRLVKGDADAPVSPESPKETSEGSEEDPKAVLRTDKAKQFYRDLKASGTAPSESASTYAKGRGGAAKKSGE